VTRNGVLELEFRSDAKRTYIHRQFASYPFHVCRPHYVTNDPPGLATLYTQSLAGGIFEGDRLNMAMHCGPGSMVHCTSQASTIIHSMSDGDASHRVEIDIENDAFVEYMPDPVILFPCANFSSSVAISITPSGELILCDSILSHDPLGKNGAFHQLKSELVVRDEADTLLACDRFLVSGSTFLSQSPGICGSYSAFASVFFISRSSHKEVLIDTIRSGLRRVSGIYGGVSHMPNECGIVTRILASNAHSMRSGINAVWSSVRCMRFGTAPQPRRK
jgi:urease accessory protein